MKNIAYICAFLCSLLFITACSTSEKDSSSFRVARERTWYALNLKDREQRVTAFNDELIQILAEAEGIDLSLVILPAGESVNELRRANIDGTLTAIRQEGAGSERFIFSEMYLALGHVLLVKTDSVVRSMDDMYEKLLGVRYGSSLVFDTSQNPSMAIREYAHIGEGIDDLVNGRIDAVAAEFLTAEDYVNNIYEGKIRMILPPVTNVGLRLMTLKDNPRGDELAERFAVGLQKLRQNGTYAELRKKWRL
ncbi:Uncharacterized protein SCG7109_AA_00390 [Chlamydiales bacterium SCGC AG-110-M15]|nr:Uncharacterized protein SCG7109_AA_00390 [Chlamydiales bacterium SCGC AG-110-M15]